MPVFNVRLEQGGEAYILQVNKRCIEEQDGKGAGLALPCAASDMISPVKGDDSAFRACTEEHIVAHGRGSAP